MGGYVVATTCPICRYTMTLDMLNDANQSSFTGDRILVSKFAYDIARPKRWDVIVFKYPGNAKQNFIKRLIGLPSDRIEVRGGLLHINDVPVTREVSAQSTLYVATDAEPPMVYLETFPGGRRHLIAEFTDTRISNNTHEYAS